VLQDPGASCTPAHFLPQLKVCSVQTRLFPERSKTCDQVASFTTFIENGFQQNLQTVAVFLDLTAACDTAWHTGLIYELSKTMPYWFTRLVGLLLRYRRFRVHMGSDTSPWRLQRNGLPQGCVLAPVLFNLYSNLYLYDLTITHGRKFIYTDNMSHHSRPILQQTGM